MRVSVISLVVAAGLATAQLEQVPKCAGSCVTEYISGNKIADCGQFDIKCICSNSAFLDGIACCLEDACDQAGKDATIKFAQQICSTQSVKVPDQIECKNKASSSETTTVVKTTTAASQDSSSSSTSADGTGATTPSGTATEQSSSDEPTSTNTASGSETQSPDAAPGVLGGMTGVLGAVAAILFAI